MRYFIITGNFLTEYYDGEILGMVKDDDIVYSHSEGLNNYYYRKVKAYV